MYHVFCDSREALEKDRTPAKAALVASFVSALAGSLSGKAIHNYIYGVRAWHTLYGLPWVLHEEQIATMLKGVAKLAPPALKQDKRKPVTIQMISLIKDKLDQMANSHFRGSTPSTLQSTSPMEMRAMTLTAMAYTPKFLLSHTQSPAP